MRVLTAATLCLVAALCIVSVSVVLAEDAAPATDAAPAADAAGATGDATVDGAASGEAGEGEEDVHDDEFDHEMDPDSMAGEEIPAADEPDLIEQNSKFVKTLTPETFEQEVGKDTPALVEFYAPWCGHCQELAPEYEKVAQSFLEEKTDKKVLLAKVNADLYSELADKHNVEAFPTLRWYPKGTTKGSRTEFEGEHNAAALTEFIEMKLATESTVEQQTENEKNLPPEEKKDASFLDEGLDNDQLNKFLADDDDDAFLRSVGLANETLSDAEVEAQVAAAVAQEAGEGAGEAEAPPAAEKEL